MDPEGQMVLFPMFTKILMYAEIFVGKKLLEYVTVCWWKIYCVHAANYLCFSIAVVLARFGLSKESPKVALPLFRFHS